MQDDHVLYCGYFNDKVVTTERVPPQQADWWEEAIRKMPSMLSTKLPAEVLDLVFKKVEWPISMETAKDHTQEYNRERTMRMDTGMQGVQGYGPFVRRYCCNEYDIY